MRNKIIEVKNLSKYYNIGKTEVEVLKSINFDIYENEMVAIMGKSGSGKSTLLNVLACLDKPNKGQYSLYGSNVMDYKEKELAKVRSSIIGMIFQNYNLIEDYTVFENIKIALLYKRYHSKISINYKKIIMKYLKMVGLEDKVDKYPSELSGGEQQRVAIARTLATNPDVILADEPTGALDEENTKEILDILKNIHAQGKTIIMVTHDKNVADTCEKIMIMRNGCIE